MATPDFSSITPIKIKSGTAISVSLVKIPKILFGKTLKRTKGNKSKKYPNNATIIEVPANVMATGKPANKKIASITRYL